MALKVSVLVFCPLFSLTPMNNQQGIKLKSKQHLLHVLEEVSASFCKMWMCPVHELVTLKAYELNTFFFSHGGLHPTPTNVSGHLFTDFISAFSQILTCLILIGMWRNQKPNVSPPLWYEVFCTLKVNLLFTEFKFSAQINVICWYINTGWLLDGIQQMCSSLYNKVFSESKRLFLSKWKKLLQKEKTCIY